MGADQLAIRVGEIAGSLTESSNKLREAGDHSAAGLRAARDELELGVRNGINVIADDEGRECSTFPDRFWFSGSGEWPNGMPQPDCDPNRNAARTSCQAGEVVGAASAKLATAAGNVETATTPLSASIRNINIALEGLSNATEQLNRSSASGKEVTNLLHGSLEKAKTVSEAQAKQFAELEVAVKQTVNDLIQGVTHLGVEISRCIDTYNSEIAKSIGSLETAILDVADIVDHRRPGVANLRASA